MTLPPESKIFRLGDLLSVVSGVVITDVEPPDHLDGIYDLIRHLSGRSCMTHELPGMGDRVRPRLIEQYPFLAEIDTPSTFPTTESVAAWLRERVAEHGDAFPVLGGSAS